MIQVQFFARYREALGRDSEQLDWDASWQVVDHLRLQLLARGGEWTVLSEQNLM